MNYKILSLERGMYMHFQLLFAFTRREVQSNSDLI